MAAAMATGGAGLGVVIGGPVVQLLGFHWLFWIPMVLTGCAALAAHAVIRESPVVAGGRVNVAAALALSGWLVSLVLAVSEGPVWGWGSDSVLILFAAALVLGVLWVRIELRAREPLIDVRMMQQRTVWTNNAVAFAFGVGLFASGAFVPVFVQTPPSAGYGFGSSISGSGLFLLCQTMCIFAVCMLAGRLMASVGAKTLLVVGSVVDAGAFLMLATARSAPWEVALSMCLLGAGAGAVLASMSALIVGAVPSEETGVASGMNANCRTIGGSVGVAVVASMLAVGVAANGYPTADAYTKAFLFLAGSAVFAVLPALLTRSDALAALARGSRTGLSADTDELAPAISPGSG
jgi:predicted MFS family arabinose efflux permease